MGAIQTKQRRQAVAPDTDSELDPASPESGIDSGNDTEDELSSASPTTTTFRSRNVKPSFFKSLGKRINRRQAVEAPDTDFEDNVNSAAADDQGSPDPPRRPTLRRRNVASAADQGSPDPPRKPTLRRRNVNSAAADDQGSPDPPRRPTLRRREVNSAAADDQGSPDPPRRPTFRRRNVNASGTAKSVSGGIKRRQAVGAPATDTEADSATDGVDTETDGVDSATENDVDSVTDGETDTPLPTRVAVPRNPTAKISSRTIGLGKRGKLVDGGQTNRRQAADVPEPESASEPESEDEDKGPTPGGSSPTETATPPGVENPADMGRIGTETPGNPAPTATAVETALPAAESSNLDAQPQEIGQSSEGTGGMGRGGVIAMGVLSKSSAY